MSKTGIIYTYTIINNATEAFRDNVPYVIAIINDGNNKTMARLERYVEGQQISVGIPVEFVDEENTVFRLLSA